MVQGSSPLSPNYTCHLCGGPVSRPHYGACMRCGYALLTELGLVGFEDDVRPIWWESGR